MGPVRELRQRLVRHLKECLMAEQHEAKMPQASAPTDSSADSVLTRPLNVNDNSHVGSGDGSVPVLVELMRQVPPLTTEEPEAILCFVVRLNGIYALGLGDDRTFIVRILPLVSGAVLRFFEDCLRNGRTWGQSKDDLLHEFFLHFVRQRMVHDLITFNFHHKGQSTRDYIDHVFTAAEFLKYDANEQQLVDRVIMNLHPSVLAHAAFLERPHSRKDLYNAAGLIQEKCSVMRERQRSQLSDPDSGRKEFCDQGQSRNTATNSCPRGCWNCGRPGQTRRNRRQRTPQSGNGQVPGGTQTTGREH